MQFSHRTDAGRQLGRELHRHRRARSGRSGGETLVLGLPRGGIPVAAEVAARLRVPLDVFVARKIGVPGHEELGIGAIAEGSDEVLVTETATAMGFDRARVEELAAAERVELDRRVQLYRQGRPAPSLEGREVILVDDGLATGVTAEAALRALRTHEPSLLTLAVPVCARDTHARLSGVADEVVCLITPPQFGSVGSWYEDFRQTGDDEVVDLLSRFAGSGRT